MVLVTMKNNLENFIKNIEKKTIKQNEVIIGNFSDKIIEFLFQKKITLKTKNIFLTVKRYHHITRDFKKKKGKSIPHQLIINFPDYIDNSLKIVFDNQIKHKNIIYLFEFEQDFYKIVINLNGEIVTAGICDIGYLNKANIFEVIK